MLRRCIAYVRTQLYLKALEVLLDLCPHSIIRQGFESDDLDEVLTSISYMALGQAKSNTAWRPVLEAILRNFSVTELDEVRELNESGSANPGIKSNVLHMAVRSGWTIAVRILLEKGVDIHRKIEMSVPITSFDVAVQAGDVEMQAILSGYGGGNENSLGSSMAHEHPAWWFFLRKRMRCRGLNHIGFGDKDTSTLFAVSKAHEVLSQLLMLRDGFFAKNPAHARYMKFEILLWDEFRALISNESFAGCIDTPDEDDVTMLQRATAYLDIDVIRLLLEAGADANVSFLATKRVDDDQNGQTVPFLPIEIACWVSAVNAGLFERGGLRTKEHPDAIVTKQVTLEPTGKPHILRRVTHIISHAAGTGAKRLKGITSGPALTSGARVAESLRTSSLNVAQELLRWHVLRNDRRFEGITEFHLCCRICYVSRCLKLVRQEVEITDVKASWPGLEGKYTGQEMAGVLQKNGGIATFTYNFRRLRGTELALKRVASRSSKIKGSGIQD